MRWLKVIAVLAAILVLGWVVLNLGSGLIGLLSGAEFEGEEDPMFAQEAEIVTRPPGIYPEETQKPHKTLDDYVPEEQSPVDKTAQELIAEAQAGA